MSVNFGPQQSWPVLWPCDVCTLSPTVSGAAASFATAVLWAATGQRFGLTEVTLRPCRKTCRPTPYPGYVWDPWPGWDNTPGGSWVNAPVIPYGGLGLVVGGYCSSCGPSCGCMPLSEVNLPAPVNEVLEVKVDGQVLAPTAYRLDDNRVVVRTDGGSWPWCQNIAANDTQPGTWSIRATYGEDVPPSALGPMGELACQFVRAFKGEDCNLPPNVQQLARQGVTIQLPDVNAYLQQGYFGLRLVDLFVNAFNPAHLIAAPQVFDVDATLARRAGS